MAGEITGPKLSKRHSMRSDAGKRRAWVLLLVSILSCRTAVSGDEFSDDELKIRNAQHVVFAVSSLTQDAQNLGLADKDIAGILQMSLHSAGVEAVQSASKGDEAVLFLDMVVEDGAFYASLDFLRTASFLLPDGRSSSDLVTVWQRYAVGAHHDDTELILQTITIIVDQFVAQYGKANRIGPAYAFGSTAS